MKRHAATTHVKRLCVALPGLLFALLSGQSLAAPESVRNEILAGFFPYRQGVAQAEGISSGLRLDQTNAQVARGVLPPELLDHLAAGEFSITVRATTDTPLRQEYIDASLQHYGKAELGETELRNYVAGSPFPLIEPNDPQAGIKAAWNYRFRDRGDNVQHWPTNEHRTATGSVERSESFHVITMYGSHRSEPAANRPAWEHAGVYYKRYMRLLSPADSEGQQILSLRYEKDGRIDDQWMYDPGTRRIRKAVYNPYMAPGNGQLLLEDTSGFNGYLSPYEWTYVGQQTVLAPGPIQRPEPRLGGKGNWYPVDPWELRKAIVLEAKSDASHPFYSRRRLYLDAQTYANLYTFTYDHAGKHRRTFLQVYFHPNFNPWNNPVWLPHIAAQLSIDYEQDRASIFQTHKVRYNTPLNEHHWFSVMSLMLHGK
jgi:hypothetical protein